MLIACLSFCRAACNVEWQHKVPGWIAYGHADHPIGPGRRIPLEFEPRAPEHLPTLDLQLLDPSFPGPSTPLSSAVAAQVLHALRNMYSNEALSDQHVALVRQTMPVFYEYLIATVRVTNFRRQVYGLDDKVVPLIFASKSKRSARKLLPDDRPELAAQFQRFATDTAYCSYFFASVVREAAKSGHPLFPSFYED